MIDTRLNFKALVDCFDHHDMAYPFVLTSSQCHTAQDTLNHVSGLLDDIGVNPDRKYTVAEVDAMAAAIDQALGGRL